MSKDKDSLDSGQRSAEYGAGGKDSRPLSGGHGYNWNMLHSTFLTYVNIPSPVGFLQNQSAISTGLGRPGCGHCLAATGVTGRWAVEKSKSRRHCWCWGCGASGAEVGPGVQAANLREGGCEGCLTWLAAVDIVRAQGPTSPSRLSSPRSSVLPFSAAQTTTGLPTVAVLDPKQEARSLCAGNSGL